MIDRTDERFEQFLSREASMIVVGKALPRPTSSFLPSRCFLGNPRSGVSLHRSARQATN